MNILSFDPSESLEDRMSRAAQCFVDDFWPQRGATNVVLDFSPRALWAIDAFIILAYWDTQLEVDDLKSLTLLFGAYFGETIQRNLGGSWTHVDDDDEVLGPVLTNVGVSQQDRAAPLDIVFKRFAQGGLYSMAHTYLLIGGGSELL